jgi:hypothetical protein
MYLARLTDGGGLSVWEIAGVIAAERGHHGYVPGVETPRTWRFGKRRDAGPMLCGAGWASIKHTEAIAIMSVHAASEQMEAA